MFFIPILFEISHISSFPRKHVLMKMGMGTRAGIFLDQPEIPAFAGMTGMLAGRRMRWQELMGVLVFVKRGILRQGLVFPPQTVYFFS